MSKQVMNEMEERLMELRPAAQDELAATIISRLNHVGQTTCATTPSTPPRSFSAVLWIGVGSFLAGAVAMFIMMTIILSPELAQNVPVDSPDLPEIVQIAPEPPEIPVEPTKNVEIAATEVKRPPFADLIEFFERVRRGAPVDLEAFIAEREAIAQRSRLAYADSPPPIRFRNIERPNEFQHQEYLEMLKRETDHFSM